MQRTRACLEARYRMVLDALLAMPRHLIGRPAHLHLCRAQVLFAGAPAVRMLRGASDGARQLAVCARTEGWRSGLVHPGTCGRGRTRQALRPQGGRRKQQRISKHGLRAGARRAWHAARGSAACSSSGSARDASAARALGRDGCAPASSTRPRAAIARLQTAICKAAGVSHQVRHATGAVRAAGARPRKQWGRLARTHVRRDRLAPAGPG